MRVNIPDNTIVQNRNASSWHWLQLLIRLKKIIYSHKTRFYYMYINFFSRQFIYGYEYVIVYRNIERVS